MPLELSVIIPVLNEADNLPACRRHLEVSLRSLHGRYEIIFVDGGSTDNTVALLQSFTAQMSQVQLLHSPRGRSLQMNMGAKHALGRQLLFLHADTQLPNLHDDNIQQMQACVWGFFPVALDNRAFIYRLIGKGINFRSMLSKVATGDQAIFIAREKFLAEGGYAEIALMEDIEFSRRLKRIAEPFLMSDKVITSARRWEKHGAVKTVLLMWGFQLAYRCGVSPKYLAEKY